MRRAKVLLISSGGGHWQQLLRLGAGLSQYELVYATVDAGSQADVGSAPFYRLHDSNRDTMLGLLRTLLEVIWILVRVRPNVIISTGAAPGYLAIRIGRWLGARTMFIDSVANAECLSMSAQLSLSCANVTLTQWPHLAQANGAQFGGSVL